MDAIPQTKPVVRRGRRLKVVLASVVVASLIAGTLVWRNHSNATAVTSKSTEAIPVLTAVVKQTNVPVELVENGTVSAQQTVAVRPQLSAVISSVHIKEGQFVKRGKDFLHSMHVQKMPIFAGLKDNWRRPALTCATLSEISNASVNLFFRILFRRLRLTWRRVRWRRCAVSWQSIRPPCRPIALLAVSAR